MTESAEQPSSIHEPPSREVVFVFRNILHYRVEFFEGLRTQLAEHGVRLRIVASRPDHPTQGRDDAVWIEWAEELRTTKLGPSASASAPLWQHIVATTRSADLIILEQASRLLANPVLTIRAAKSGQPKVALWGHGQNPPRGRLGQLAEWVKPKLNRGVHWWFAYTTMVRDRLVEQGFDPERITVFQNAYDSRLLAAELDAARAEPASDRRARFGLDEGTTALCISSIYDWKRIDFLIECVPWIRASIPDFQLVVAGGGPLAPSVRAQAAAVEGVVMLDPVTGSDKAALGSLADLTMLGGAVGLSVLDGFIFGTPLVALEDDHHGPEIDYLLEANAGVMVPAHAGPEEYAAAVVALLREPTRSRVSANSAAAAEVYTVEAMIDRYAAGIIAALDAAAEGSEPRA